MTLLLISLGWAVLGFLIVAGFHRLHVRSLDARLAPHVRSDLECRTCGAPTFRPRCAEWCERIGAGA